MKQTTFAMILARLNEMAAEILKEQERRAALARMDLHAGEQ
jgi:hypothetical protein